MFAVRGAVTCEANTAEEIISATKEMLGEIMERNCLEKDEIINAFFTVTHDLDKAFPARAAREMGWDRVPMMCALEINVEGSLPRCVRVMLLADRQGEGIPVYLKGASSLRPDLESESHNL